MKLNWRKPLHDFLKDDSGQDLIEYALVTAVLALGAVTMLKPISTALGTLFTSIATAIGTA